MTEYQCLLAIDAALTNAEGFITDKETNDAIDVLYNKLTEYFDKQGRVFDKYLQDQKEACKLLASSPVLFGEDE